MCMAQLCEEKGFKNNSRESCLPSSLYIPVFPIYGIFWNASWTLDHKNKVCLMQITEKYQYKNRHFPKISLTET